MVFDATHGPQQTIAFGTGGTPNLNLDGSGSLYVGGTSGAAGGLGTLAVRNGGVLELGGTLKLWSTGTVILDGGTIRTQTFDRSAGTFTWTSGTVQFSQNLSIAPAEPFGQAITVGAAQALTVTQTLSVPSGGSLLVNGGTVTAGLGFGIFALRRRR